MLEETGAASRVLPEWSDSARVRAAVDLAAREGLPLASRFALLCVDSTEVVALSKHLRAPSECADMARLLQLLLSQLDEIETAQQEVHPDKGENVERVLCLMEACDALRKPERFTSLIQTASILRTLRTQDWQRWLAAVLSLDAGAAAKQAPSPQLIKQTVREARRLVLQEAF